MTMKTEGEVRAHLLKKAESDSAFRASLLADPRGTVEKEFGISVPEGFDLRVHEDTATSAHLVLPSVGGRLGSEEMQAIAGGSNPGPWGTPYPPG